MRLHLASLGAANWLSLAASPVFALMALLTAVLGDTHSALCSQSQQVSPISGMAPMYLLMAAFHLAPWFRLTGRLINPCPALPSYSTGLPSMLPGGE